MLLSFGDYNLRVHELDNKLIVQVTSPLGETHIKEEYSKDACSFPNEIVYEVLNPSKKPEPKGLKRFSFGEYTFILGINNGGDLCLFHSVRLIIGKKKIEGIDTLTLAFLKEPKA